jgi:hypothetical protein
VSDAKVRRDELARLVAHNIKGLIFVSVGNDHFGVRNDGARWIAYRSYNGAFLRRSGKSAGNEE